MTDYAMTKELSGNFRDSREKVVESLKANGFGIITEIDVQKTFKEKLGLKFDHYIILGACNPNSAHNAIQAESEIGLLLPCNVIVYEKDAKVYVSMIKPTSAMVMSDSSVVLSIAEEVENKLSKALEEVSL